MTIFDLAELIRANPHCVATVDNDFWWIDREPMDENPYEEDDDRASGWESENRLISADEITEGGYGYGEGSSYGGDILQALAHIVGIKVQSV